MTFSRGTESLSTCSPKEEPAGNSFFLPFLPPISGWWYLLFRPNQEAEGNEHPGDQPLKAQSRMENNGK